MTFNDQRIHPSKWKCVEVQSERDAATKYPGWTKTEFDDSNWGSVQVMLRSKCTCL